MKKADMIEKIKITISIVKPVIQEANGKLHVPEDFNLFRVGELEEGLNWLETFYKTLWCDYNRFKRYQPAEAWDNFIKLDLHNTPEIRELKKRQLAIRKYLRKYPLLFTKGIRNVKKVKQHDTDKPKKA